jgi:hypothetical protein
MCLFPAFTGGLCGERSTPIVQAVIHEDYIVRMIKQLAAFLARITRHRERGEYAKAMDEASDAWTHVLGVPRELVDATDPPTLIELLREPGKLRLAARLLAEEAHVMTERGDPLNASVLRARAIELVIAARALEPCPDDDSVIMELSRD